MEKKWWNEKEICLIVPFFFFFFVSFFFVFFFLFFSLFEFYRVQMGKNCELKGSNFFQMENVLTKSFRELDEPHFYGVQIIIRKIYVELYIYFSRIVSH